MLTHLLEGFALVFRPQTFALMVFGTALGVIIGALPGMTGSMGIILLLPIVFWLPPDTAMIMLAGLFCGSMMGGSVSAILLRTPGTPSASATLLDGYPLCRQGRAGKAIGIATVASFFGGIFSTACLILIAPQLAKIALQFQAADFFSLSIFGLTIMASASAKNIVKGLLAGWLGLLASTVGIDVIVGVPRFTFDNMYLMGGFQLLPVLIGVFAVAQVLWEVRLPAGSGGRVVEQKIRLKDVIPSWGDLKVIAAALLVGSVIGVFIGIIPGTGGAISCFLAYNIVQKWSKNRHRFGNGAIEGIAAPEASNNATTGGALIPMLTLGVPGDAVTAVMLGALTLIGVRPGPLLFVEMPQVVYAIFSGMITIQFVMLILGFLSAKFAPYVLKVPREILMPIIMALCVVGSFTLGNSLFDVFVALVFGVIGFFMRKYGYPGAPLVLGVILGPMAEDNLNRAMLVSGNDWSILLRRPISAFFLVLSVISITFALAAAYKANKEEKRV
ncbi:MAG: tripartite tricarboxylate transporter permease [Spirochaetales bacterium]|jgi:putative tricarboxylic transport membrane protein|nr:tripartite tricarboxylate transporter permease [Spirochaetales bacterium]